VWYIILFVINNRLLTGQTVDITAFKLPQTLAAVSPSTTLTPSHHAAAVLVSKPQLVKVHLKNAKKKQGPRTLLFMLFEQTLFYLSWLCALYEDAPNPKSSMKETKFSLIKHG
jgi:hypothetical protein